MSPGNVARDITGTKKQIWVSVGITQNVKIIKNPPSTLAGDCHSRPTPPSPRNSPPPLPPPSPRHSPPPPSHTSTRALHLHVTHHHYFMVIDKSWTLLERHEKAFYIGLMKFVDDCKPLVNSARNIKCPCKSCRIVLWVSIENLPKHITTYGWDPGYKILVHHGESDLPPPLLVIDNTRQPQMGDMIALLNDLSYIPPNNEQNEPTQGDIGETSNEPTQAKCNEFEELYVSANEELYPGCDYVTRLDFMAKFTYFKVKDLHFRLVCKTSRWKDSNTPRKKVPKKVLCYFPIIPRLQRLYKSSHTAKEMTWHATGKCMEPGKMQHPVDGRARKNFDTKYPNFAKEPRNIRLGLAADGFNPFGNLSQAYSMWPVILTTYNLPPWLCMKDSSFMLTLLIPGPKSPGKDVDVYLRPLIDDLKVLWALKV
ncbi:reverse transcriptase domain-containing protein [Tanacetum coccineum]